MTRSPRSPLLKFHKPVGNTTASGIYVSPYLSCKDCNALNFINAVPLGMGYNLVSTGKPPVVPGKHTFDIQTTFASLEREVLPTCVGCGRTLHLAVGALDFSPVLADQATAFQKSGVARHNAAIQLQCAGRGLLARKEALRRRLEKARRDELERLAAIAIQRRMRGVISRQTTRIQSGVRIIHWTHPLITSMLLDEDKHDLATKTALFWFHDDDLELICSDYRQYLDRCGPLMTLQRFETNVVCFVHRINDMERRMAIRIQASWRGLQARRAVKMLKRAMGAIEERRFNAAVLLQRTVRRYAGGKLTRRHSFQRRKEKIRQRAKADCLKQRRANGLQRDVDQVKALYQSYRRKTDRVATWVVPTNVPRNPVEVQSDTQVLAAFAKSFGSFVSCAAQKHKAGHTEALRQIHKFNDKSRCSPPKKLQPMMVIDTHKTTFS
ncbi:hypothetical protein H257_01504 [Aphanomyces astaci]|uniref:Uncharacterized protein n=1 Tax=Aphanomyces astaci TaxID=112090 RepID=W4H9F6_APHAT|nr:hypothetical protein H257_01504 [Aphanomyces astaci]ETV88196.1 hypothetical protein H257_01504 [Aphanomyces astaci]|eukprot:XP_009823059.1 hypothetical protein H257_01504 [Aphanomyces astaci]